MTCRVWNDDSEAGNIATSTGGGKQLCAMDAHTEFAMGVDWCMFGQPGWCASCGWDERVLVWDVNALISHAGKF